MIRRRRRRINKQSRMSAFVVFDVEICDRALAAQAYRHLGVSVDTRLGGFYYGPVHPPLKAIRDECSSARLVSVEGIPV